MLTRTAVRVGQVRITVHDTHVGFSFRLATVNADMVLFWHSRSLHLGGDVKAESYKAGRRLTPAVGRSPRCGAPRRSQLSVGICRRQVKARERREDLTPAEQRRLWGSRKRWYLSPTRAAGAKGRDGRLSLTLTEGIASVLHHGRNESACCRCSRRWSVVHWAFYRNRIDLAWR
jgi:hypothetical protein